MKTCSKCNLNLSEDDFNKKGKYLQSYCKSCQKGLRDKHYEKYKQKYIDKAIRRRGELQRFLDSIKVKAKCERCGFDHVACLDFHHINADDKEIGLSSAALNGWSKKRILKEVSKCKVLCSNCHRILHYNEKSS